MKRFLSFVFLSLLLGLSGPVCAQDGSALYQKYCATCHQNATDQGAPSRDVIAKMSPEQILEVLEKGPMKAQAAERSRAQRRALAEYLSGKPFGGDPLNVIPKSAFCNAGGKAQASLDGPAWNGWGVTLTNSRFVPAETARLAAQDVPHLQLKWAFGYPGASSGGTEPVVVGGRLYVGDAEGDLYALDAQTGCIYWTTEVEAGIRSAVTIGKRAGGLAAYFGDQAANMYAVDADSGKTLWKVKVDDASRAAITGAPMLYEGILYVPISSREEGGGGDPKYACCTFRGSVAALNAATGKQIWKTYTVTETNEATQENRIGTQLYGPAGGAVWNTPTIDVKRSVLYVGTGNNYSPPATSATDSVIALDLKSGKKKWVHQFTSGDVWNGSCLIGGEKREPAVCPEADAPDADFASSPVLVKLPSGREILLVANKAGMTWALDPDRQGKTIWAQNAGKGSIQGGVLWGFGVDAEKIYVPNGFFDQANPDASGDIAALALSNGHVVWRTPNPPCADRKPCKPSHTAAVTIMPGVVFSGTMDGHLYAYSTEDGKILLDLDTVRDYPTLNGVKAKGGSLSNSGPTIVNGTLYLNSGYSHHGGVIPGNVLLAFSAQ